MQKVFFAIKLVVKLKRARGGAVKKTKYMAKGGKVKNTKYMSKGGAVKKTKYMSKGGPVPQRYAMASKRKK